MTQSDLSDYQSDGGESHKDEETLRRLYHGEEMTQREIGERFGVTGAAVSYWMDEYNIESRSALEATRLNGEDIPYRDEETLRRLYYDEQMTVAEIADKFDCSKWPINHWMDEHDIERRGPSEFQRIRWDDEADHEPITEEWLQELYVEQKLSTRAVAEEIGCERGKVERRLEEYGIEQRSMSEAAKIRSSRKPAWFGVANHGYEAWDTHVDGEWPQVLVHRLAAVAWFGWEEVTENVVHHKNKHKRDNRESNLELMGIAEHSKMHAEAGDIGFLSDGNQYSPPPEER